MQPAVKGNCLLIALGHPIGASSIPVGKGISKGNSVLLCLGCSEGIEFPFDWKNPKKPAVSWHTTFLRKVQCVIPLWSRWQPELQHTLESSATVAAFWRERLPLAGQHKRQKKGWQAVRICTVCQPCHLWNKGISKPSVSRCLLSYQNHHGSFPRRLSIASPSTFFVRFSLRWK